MRDNQIIGYGLVVGLKGSGDTMRNSPLYRAIATIHAR